MHVEYRSSETGKLNYSGVVYICIGSRLRFNTVISVACK